MDGAAIPPLADGPATKPWARAEFLSDSRQKAPAATAALGLSYVRGGLPLRVDLYAYPAAKTQWPVDCRVVFERRPVTRGSPSFDELNASGPRQPATVKTETETRRIQLRMLRDIASRLSQPSWTRLSDAVSAYLDLVAADITPVRDHGSGAAGEHERG